MPAGLDRSPGIGPFRTASPACTAPPGPADLPTRSKDGRNPGKAHDCGPRAGSALFGRRAASGFPAPPLPPLGDPGSSSRAPRTRFSPLLSPSHRLSPRSALSLSDVFTLAPRSPSPRPPDRAPPRLSPPPSPQGLANFAPTSGLFRRVPPRKSRGAQSRERSRRTPEHPGSRAPDRACLDPGRGQEKGRGRGREKQDPGEGVTVGGDTGDGYPAGHLRQVTLRAICGLLIYQRQNSRVEHPLRTLRYSHDCSPSVSRSSFKRAK